MRHSSFSLKQTSLALAMLLAAGCGAAQAQLDEIIVTAERRATNLQDVPVAVTALDAATIERLGIHDPSSLQMSVPNFTFKPFSPGQSVFSLRGVSSNDDGAGTDNSVAVFLDGVYFGRISNAAFNFFDVESVEVLRGPQGTLWGKNAIGGAINITSKKPSLDGFEAKGKIEIGEYNTQNFGGYVTGPLNDNWAFKISTSTRKHDGFETNLLDFSGTGDNKPNNENSSSWRAQLLYEDGPTSALFTAAQQIAEENDIGRMPIERQNPASTGPRGTVATYGAFVAGGGSKENRLSVNPNNGFANSENETYSMEINHELDSGIQLTSITAFYETSARWEMDSVGHGGINLIDDIRDATEAYSQEFRIAADLSDDIDIVGGLFYLSEKTDRSEHFRWIWGADDRGSRGALEVLAVNAAPAVIADPAANPPVIGRAAVTAVTAVPGERRDAVGAYRQINETTSFAAFAHANWQFAPDWSLGLGLRYTEDEKDLVSTASVIGVGPAGTPGFIITEAYGDIATGGGADAKVDSGSWDDVTTKLSLNWNANDSTLIYVSYADGFKSGGFGAAPANASANITLAPETAESLEIGIKADLLNDTLRINASAFQTDYSDLQVQRFGPLLRARTAAEQLITDTMASDYAGICGSAPTELRSVSVGGDTRGVACGGFGAFRTVNIGDADITGFELEVTYAPTPNLTLTGNYGYLDTEATLDFSSFFTPNTAADVVTSDLTLSRPLLRSPESKYSLGLLYESDMSAKGQLIYSLNYSYTDESSGDYVDAYAVDEDYSLVDTSITYIPSEDAPWAFTLWAKNLTDENYFAHVYTVGPGVIGTLAPPRVLGASVSFEIN